jgi:hypothetical protein
MVTTRSCHMVCSPTKPASPAKKSKKSTRRCTYKPYRGKQYKGVNNYNKCTENKTRRAERQKGYRTTEYKKRQMSKALPFNYA